MYIAESTDITISGLGDPGRRRRRLIRKFRGYLSVRWNRFHKRLDTKDIKSLNRAIADTMFIAHRLERYKQWDAAKSAYGLLRAQIEYREKHFPKWECQKGLVPLTYGYKPKWSPKSLVEIHCERAFYFMPKTECIKKLSWLYCQIPPEKAIEVPEKLRLLPIVAKKPPGGLSGIIQMDWLEISNNAVQQLGQVEEEPYQEGLEALRGLLKDEEFKRFYPVIAGGLLTVAIWKALHPEAGEMMDYEKEALHKWAQGMAAVGELEKTWMYARKLLEPIPVTSRNLEDLAHWKLSMAQQDKEVTHGYKLNKREYDAYRSFRRRKARRARQRKWRKIAVVVLAAAAAIAAVVAIPGAAAVVGSVIQSVGSAIATAAQAVASAIWWAIRGAAGIIYEAGKWVYDSLIKPLFVGADGKAGKVMDKVTKAAKETGIFEEIVEKGGKKIKEAAIDALKRKIKEKLGAKQKKLLEQKQVRMKAKTADTVTTYAPAGELPRPTRLTPQPPSQPPPQVALPGEKPEVPKSIQPYIKPKIPTAVMVGIPVAAAVVLALTLGFRS